MNQSENFTLFPVITYLLFEIKLNFAQMFLKCVNCTINQKLANFICINIRNFSEKMQTILMKNTNVVFYDHYNLFPN